jgi:HlyD family secretion protein
MKIKIRYIAILIIIVVIAWFFILPSLFKSPIAGYSTTQIDKGDVIQEISETGNVRATDSLSLGFKNIGKVTHIYVAVGDVVKKGEVLASLDSSQTIAQLNSARAALDYTSNQYDSSVATAKDNLQSAYNSASNVLNDAYTKVYNAYNAVVDLQNTYFTLVDQSGTKVREGKADIEQSMQNIKKYLDAGLSNSSIDSAVSDTLAYLNNVYNDLKIIRAQCDDDSYYHNVSSTYKTSIDTQKTYINTALSSLTASQTSINAYKIALQKAQDNTIDQAQASVNLYQSQLADASMVAPMDGTITQVNIKRGETVSPAQSVINLLSNNQFQIKTYIYEQDIVNTKVGNDVKIELVAFPKQVFMGKVLSIDPAETIVDNVIYYQVTIDFPSQPSGIRSGMTADITIEANKKTDVLRVPSNAISNINGQDTVQVFKDGKIQDQKIITGLEGNDYYEVLSGLRVGDIIVTGKQ